MLGDTKMATTRDPVIGYFKVFTTDGRHVRDLDAYEGPRTKVARRSGWHTLEFARKNIAQWIFTFTKSTREAARTKAFAKADVVHGRLDYQGSIEIHDTHMDNVYAIRVGTAR